MADERNDNFINNSPSRKENDNLDRRFNEYNSFVDVKKYEEKTKYQEISSTEVKTKPKKKKPISLMMIATFSTIVIATLTFTPELIIDGYPNIEFFEFKATDEYYFLEASFSDEVNVDDFNLIIYNDFEKITPELYSEGSFIGSEGPGLKPNTKFKIKLYYNSYVIYSDSIYVQKEEPYNIDDPTGREESDNDPTGREESNDDLTGREGSNDDPTGREGSNNDPINIEG